MLELGRVMTAYHILKLFEILVKRYYLSNGSFMEIYQPRQRDLYQASNPKES